MNLSAESQKTVEAYLAGLRKQLRRLPYEDVNDIVEEIRAHVLDKVSDGAKPETVASTLSALGTPEELAERYQTDELLKRAQNTRSPIVIFRSLLRWATLSFVGFLVFLTSIVGYCVGGGLVVLAVFKLMWPQNTGLWKNIYSDGKWGVNLSFSSGAAPHHTQELLGWWLVPLGFLVGAGLLFLTFRFGNWCIRRFWRPRAWR